MLFDDSKRLEQRVIDVLHTEDGLTDRQIAEKISEERVSYYLANGVCRQLEYKDKLKRVWHKGKELTNHLV